MSENLFTTQTPLGNNFSEGQPTTLATTVTFAVAGTVSGGRFLAPLNTGGTYELVLWSVDTDDRPADTGTGTVLATASFGPLTAGVWNSVSFASPVAVSNNVAYRIGVRSSEGRYQASTGFFTSSSLVNGNITGIQNGADPFGVGALDNGNYINNSLTAYPNKTYNANCYFVDVNFDAATSGPSPSGVAVPGAPGSPSTSPNLSSVPAGLAVLLALGPPAAALNRTAAPAGIAVPVALVAPASNGSTPAPGGLAVPVALGAPTVALSRTAAPGGLAAPAGLGTPSTSLSRVGFPAGLAVIVRLGAPSPLPPQQTSSPRRALVAVSRERVIIAVSRDRTLSN